MPKVSVLTTVHDGGGFFDRSVPWVLGQTLSDFEWILVDDGSRDNTPEMLASLAHRDHRVRVLSPGRMGRSAALNLGVLAARADYVAIQDIDDISYRNRLELQASYLDRHPDVGVLGGSYVVVDSNRHEHYVRYPPVDHEEIRRSMVRHIPFAHTLVMFRKDAWAQAAGYPPTEDLEDLRLWAHIARRGWKLANLTVVLGEHFVHPRSYWHRHRRYLGRQLELIRLSTTLVGELALPRWYLLFPIGRAAYALLPNVLKRVVRRWLGRSREHDLRPSIVP